MSNFSEDNRVQLITSILEDMTDRFWVVCEKHGEICVIGYNPNEMVSALLNTLSSSVVYPLNKQYLNDRFDQLDWDSSSWN
jgi:hypothetical protein